MVVEAQMPLSYTSESPLTLEVRLAGVSIYAKPRGSFATALHVLKDIGVDATNEPAGIRIHVKDLRRLVEAYEKIRLACEHPLDIMAELLSNPPVEEAPVVVTIDTPETLNLSWPGEKFEHNESFPASASAALIAAGIPVVAHPEAWSRLAGSTVIPLPLAHARIGAGKYIELTTPAPYKLAASGLPALFQTGEAKYGIPITHADRVRRTPGIMWSGPTPTVERLPARTERTTYRLSKHAEEELEKLASDVGETFSRTVCWTSGLGRRVFALAAIDRLDGWPCTILATPSYIWAWHRIAGMFERTIASTHPRADIHLLLYQHAAVRPDSPASLIFDEASTLVTENPELLGSTKTYEALLDPYRIALASHLPEDPQKLKDLMALVRPAEFRRGLPYMALYPNEAERRLKEHAACYLSIRTERDAVPAGFPSSGTIKTRPTLGMRKLLEEILSEDRDPAAKAAEALDLISRGSGSTLSPKIPAAVGKAREAISEGCSIAIVANGQETLDIIGSMLGEKEKELVNLVEAGRNPPRNLKAYNRVLYVDYPQSFSYIDESVGRLGSPGCPRRVDIIHMAGTTDDRIARISGIRHESSALVDPNRPYTDSELAAIAGRHDLP